MKGPFYIVPAGHASARCKGSTCRAVVYWMRDGERAVPVDCSVDGGIVPSETADASQIDLLSGATPEIRNGRGVHHMSVCPCAKEFGAR
jgi:hypothetical protein